MTMGPTIFVPRKTPISSDSPIHLPQKISPVGASILVLLNPTVVLLNTIHEMEVVRRGEERRGEAPLDPILILLMDLASTGWLESGLTCSNSWASTERAQTTVKDLTSDKATYLKLMVLDGRHAYAAELVASPAMSPMKLRAREVASGHAVLPRLLRRHASHGYVPLCDPGRRENTDENML
jgi:hypothetical protein